MPKFFSAAQFAALRSSAKRSIFAPPMKEAPGAIEAGAPEFLDFLLSESPADRQQLYKNGLDLLNSQSKKRYNKAFADLDKIQCVLCLLRCVSSGLLNNPRTHSPDSLRAAKQDVRTKLL